MQVAGTRALDGGVGVGGHGDPALLLPLPPPAPAVPAHGDAVTESESGRSGAAPGAGVWRRARWTARDLRRSLSVCVALTSVKRGPACVRVWANADVTFTGKKTVYVSDVFQFVTEFFIVSSFNFQIFYLSVCLVLGETGV